MAHKVAVSNGKTPKFVSIHPVVRYHKTYLFALDTHGRVWRNVSSELTANHRWENVSPGGGKAMVVSDQQD